MNDCKRTGNSIDEVVEDKKKYEKVLANWETPFTKSTDQAWSELEPKLSAKTIVVQGFFHRYRKQIAVASAAAVALLFTVLLWPADSIHEIAVLQQQTVVLPDQSSMTLNAHSSAKFAEKWNSERVVELDGQAFFDVKSGEKFLVKTDIGAVEVLGTSFDVYDRSDIFRVKCYTGKVNVTSANTTLVLTPGQFAELNNKQLVQKEFDLAQGDWRKGEFYFKEEPVTMVFEEIERQFNVEISLPNLKERYFTGRFSNKDLNKALETVCLSMGLKYSIVDNKVFITEV